jgi:hypothetical protein
MDNAFQTTCKEHGRRKLCSLAVQGLRAIGRAMSEAAWPLCLRTGCMQTAVQVSGWSAGSAGRKPDGVCAVVGAMGEAPWPDNSTADIIFTTGPMQPAGSGPTARMQYFWEAFPAATGPRDRCASFERSAGCLVCMLWLLAASSEDGFCGAKHSFEICQPLLPGQAWGQMLHCANVLHSC